MGSERQRGATMVELMTSVSILAVSTAGAVSGLHPLLQKRQTEALAAEVAADLQFARMEAVSRNTGLRFSFEGTAVGGRCYVIHTGSAGSCSCLGADGPVCQGDAQAIKAMRLPADAPAQVSANVRSMLFDPALGTVTPTARISIDDSAGRRIDHVVNLLGRVRTCSPSTAGASARNC